MPNWWVHTESKHVSESVEKIEIGKLNRVERLLPLIHLRQIYEMAKALVTV